MNLDDCILPDWTAPTQVRALITTRAGGVSEGAYASMNPADHVGDDPAAVNQNRALLRGLLPSEPHWLKQVHGSGVHVADASPAVPPEADACVSRTPGAVCVVLTADCLPVLLCDEAGGVVGVAHAGWRGLCNGVIERTVEAMGVAPARLLAYLGPAIGPQSFEVGEEVRAAFMAVDPAAVEAFQPGAQSGKWLADIYRLARQRLHALGVQRVSGGGDCTYLDGQRFFSFRRDQATGRMASLIWLEA